MTPTATRTALPNKQLSLVFQDFPPPTMPRLPPSAFRAVHLPTSQASSSSTILSRLHLLKPTALPSSFAVRASSASRSLARPISIRTPLSTSRPTILSALLPSSSSPSSMGRLQSPTVQQVRCVTYGTNYQPSQRKRKRKHGFLVRSKGGRLGRRTLKNRRAKGRRFLSH